MKIAFLPNWCKYLSIALFVAAFFVDYTESIKAFTAGYNAALNSNYHLSAPPTITTWKTVMSDLFIFLSMMVYIFSKDKTDDEYINNMRGKALLVALLVTIVVTFIFYVFEKNIDGLTVVLIQFLLYIVLFQVMKFVLRVRVEGIDEEENV